MAVVLVIDFCRNDFCVKSFTVSIIEKRRQVCTDGVLDTSTKEDICGAPWLECIHAMNMLGEGDKE